MWCPVCKNEYIEGVTTCVDCGSELVTELPEEIDPAAPQVIGSVVSEEIGNKFIRFFRFSGIQTCGLIQKEDGEGFDIVVKGAELDRALTLVQTFANVETNDELDYNAIAPIIEGHLDEIKDEEGKELLSDLRNEASTVYVNKKDKYTDLKFSGYSFIVFGIVGYLFVGINLAGIFRLFNNFSMCVLGVVFTAFLVFGVMSLRKASNIKGLVSEEENVVEKVQEYIEEHFTDEYFASLEDDTLSEEEGFFHVTEILKAEIAEQFPLFGKGYIDQLADDCYGEYCDRKAE